MIQPFTYNWYEILKYSLKIFFYNTQSTNLLSMVHIDMNVFEPFDIPTHIALNFMGN